jgi:hypothetical protein
VWIYQGLTPAYPEKDRDPGEHPLRHIAEIEDPPHWCPAAGRSVGPRFACGGTELVGDSIAVTIKAHRATEKLVRPSELRAASRVIGIELKSGTRPSAPTTPPRRMTKPATTPSGQTVGKGNRRQILVPLLHNEGWSLISFKRLHSGPTLPLIRAGSRQRRSSSPLKPGMKRQSDRDNGCP